MLYFDDDVISVGYHQFLIAGYENPYIDTAGLCTYCLDNPLTMDQNQLTATTPANNILDHVLLRGIRGTVVQVHQGRRNNLKIRKKSGREWATLPFWFSSNIFFKSHVIYFFTQVC